MCKCTPSIRTMICKNCHTRVSDSSQVAGSALNGLKDHQISELVNRIKLDVQPYCRGVGWMREVVARATVSYLEENGLRVDRPNAGNETRKRGERL